MLASMYNGLGPATRRFGYVMRLSADQTTRKLWHRPCSTSIINASCSAGQLQPPSSSSIRGVSSSSSQSDQRNHQQRRRRRRDPTAYRPSAKCDPYGQSGQPLPTSEAKQLLATLSPAWQLAYDNDNVDENVAIRDPQQKSNPAAANSDLDVGNSQNEISAHDDTIIPTALVRVFRHASYLQGAALLSRLAAVAELHAHYPSLRLERVRQRHHGAWQTHTIVTCRTHVLNGLSSHDFHVAMMMDVEVERPDIRQLIADDEHTS